eukprot:15432415-Alexandrium_andersonii.AAC.1
MLTVATRQEIGQAYPAMRLVTWTPMVATLLLLILLPRAASACSTPVRARRVPRLEGVAPARAWAL